VNAAFVDAGLAVVDEAAEVCGVVGDLAQQERECGAGTSRSRLVASDSVDQAVTVPRQRKTAMIRYKRQ